MSDFCLVYMVSVFMTFIAAVIEWTSRKISKDIKMPLVTHRARSITVSGKTFSCYLVTWN